MAREALEADEKRGERLRTLRKRFEYADLKSAASGAGVSEGGLRKWESGGEIELKSVAALARFYGASPRWIVEGKEPMFRPGDDFLARLDRLEALVMTQSEQLAELLGGGPPRDPDDSGEPGGELHHFRREKD